MTTVEMLQQYADYSADHRNVFDPDVSVCLHEIQKWVEIEILDQQHRLPTT